MPRQASGSPHAGPEWAVSSPRARGGHADRLAHRLDLGSRARAREEDTEAPGLVGPGA